MSIVVHKDKKLGDFTSWPTWSSKPDHFDWKYDQEEHCYIVEGEATIESDNEITVSIGPGDYVIFPQGLKCHWTVHRYIKKHYSFK